LSSKWIDSLIAPLTSPGDSFPAPSARHWRRARCRFRSRNGNMRSQIWCRGARPTEKSRKRRPCRSAPSRDTSTRPAPKPAFRRSPNCPHWCGSSTSWAHQLRAEPRSDHGVAGRTGGTKDSPRRLSHPCVMRPDRPTSEES